MNLLLSRNSIVFIILISSSLLVGLISYISLVIYFKKHPEKIKKIKTLYKNEIKFNSNDPIYSSFVIIKTHLNDYRVELFNKAGNVLLFTDYFHSKFVANDCIKRIISGITCAQFIKESGVSGEYFYLIKVDNKITLYSTFFINSSDMEIDIELIKKEVFNASKMDVTIKGNESFSKIIKPIDLISLKLNKVDGKYYLSYNKGKEELFKTISYKHRNDVLLLKSQLSKSSSLLEFETTQLGSIHLSYLMDKNKKIIMFGGYSDKPEDLIKNPSLLEKRYSLIESLKNDYYN